VPSSMFGAVAICYSGRRVVVDVVAVMVWLDWSSLAVGIERRYTRLEPSLCKRRRWPQTMKP
jgi:hypothetical protein